MNAGEGGGGGVEEGGQGGGEGVGGISSLTPRPDFSSSTVRLWTNIEIIVGLKISHCFTHSGHLK